MMKYLYIIAIIIIIGLSVYTWKLNKQLQPALLYINSFLVENSVKALSSGKNEVRKYDDDNLYRNIKSSSIIPALWENNLFDSLRGVEIKDSKDVIEEAARINLNFSLSGICYSPYFKCIIIKRAESGYNAPDSSNNADGKVHSYYLEGDKIDSKYIVYKINQDNVLLDNNGEVIRMQQNQEEIHK